jgi:hypothetical protein
MHWVRQLRLPPGNQSKAPASIAPSERRREMQVYAGTLLDDLQGYRPPAGLWTRPRQPRLCWAGLSLSQWWGRWVGRSWWCTGTRRRRILSR